MSKTLLTIRMKDRPQDSMELPTTEILKYHNKLLKQIYYPHHRHGNYKKVVEKKKSLNSFFIAFCSTNKEPVTKALEH